MPRSNSNSHNLDQVCDNIIGRKIREMETNDRYRNEVLHYIQRRRNCQTLSQLYDQTYDSFLEILGNSQKLERNEEGERIEPDFIKLTKLFEPILQRDLRYRDHFIHSFNVFLLGYYIINKLRNHNTIDNSWLANDTNLAWMLTSLFHDVAYPIQQIDNSINGLLNSFIGLNPQYSIPIGSSIPPIYVDLMRDIAIEEKGHHRLNEDPQRAIDWRFYNHINEKTIEKDHGVWSSLILAHWLYVRLDFFNERLGNYQYNHIPAIHAICTHNLPNYKCVFSDHPLSFLLVLCDELQDWGRPTLNQERDVFTIHDIDVDRSRMKVQIVLNINQKRRENLTTVLNQRLANTPRIQFKIVDMNNNLIYPNLNYQ